MKTANDTQCAHTSHVATTRSYKNNTSYKKLTKHRICIRAKCQLTYLIVSGIISLESVHPMLGNVLWVLTYTQEKNIDTTASEMNCRLLFSHIGIGRQQLHWQRQLVWLQPASEGNRWQVIPFVPIGQEMHHLNNLAAVNKTIFWHWPSDNFQKRNRARDLKVIQLKRPYIYYQQSEDASLIYLIL
jgi:hypothetical protein